MKTKAIIGTILVSLAFSGAAAAQSGATSKILGTPVSAITIDLFSDFQCPSCKQLHEQTLALLIQNYVRTGRVYLVQHDFPLPQHAYAKTAACYACAAERVGKYEQVCDALFSKQQEWEKSGKVDETACSVLTPTEAAKVRALAKDPAIVSEVEKDTALGTSKGVQGTPTMLISYKGKSYPVGPVSYPVLSRLLDSLR